MSQLHADLLALKENLITHGWLQGRYCENANRSIGRRCILGGIHSVVSGACYPWLRGGQGRLGHATAHRIADVGCFLMDLLDHRDLAWWNDAPGRTFEDVVDLLDRAIVLTAPVESITDREPEEAVAA